MAFQGEWTVADIREALETKGWKVVVAPANKALLDIGVVTMEKPPGKATLAIYPAYRGDRAASSDFLAPTLVRYDYSTTCHNWEQLRELIQRLG